jgi:acetyl/propionyl-CoA carboxylase alpha subunit
MIFKVNVGETAFRIKLERDGQGWRVESNGQPIPVDAKLIERDTISLIINGKTCEIKRDQLGNQIRIWIENLPYAVELFDPRSLTARSRNRGTSGTSRLVASMPGKILRVLAGEMEQVEAGQSLIVVEAMKMQNEIKSPSKGIVKQLVSEGTYVNAGDVLAIVE